VRVLTAKWDTATRVSPENSGPVTGEKSDDAKSDADSAAAVMAKPMFIYVTDGSSDGSSEKVILDANKVLVAMKAFKCVKMAPDAVNDDPLLSGKSKEDSYFMIVSRDYSKITVLDRSKKKTKPVYKAMVKHAKMDYGTNLDKNVKATLKLILEFDKINNGRKVLTAKKERLGADISKGEAKKIAAELKELDERQKAADTMKDKLLTFKVKSKKKSA
jgi:hypothetical protein